MNVRLHGELLVRVRFSRRILLLGRSYWFERMVGNFINIRMSSLLHIKHTVELMPRNGKENSCVD
jgi:hypothetical protein